MKLTQHGRRFIPEPEVCVRYGVEPLTLRRWDDDESLGFPKAILIRNRKYRDEEKLDAFDAAQAAKQGKGRRPGPKGKAP